MKMTKGERLTAEILGELPAQGYPVLTETHPFLRKVTVFMAERKDWLGIVTDLLRAVKDAYTPPNTAAKLLRLYEEEVLNANGIEVVFERTSRKRIVRLHNRLFSPDDGSVYGSMTVSPKR